MPACVACVTLVPARRGTAARTHGGGSSLFTVIACVAFVVVGIVGAMKMEDHLDPRSTRRETRAPAER